MPGNWLMSQSQNSSVHKYNIFPTSKLCSTKALPLSPFSPLSPFCMAIAAVLLLLLFPNMVHFNEPSFRLPLPAGKQQSA